MKYTYPQLEMTEKEVRESLAHYEKIHELLEPVVDAYLNVNGDFGSADNIYIEGDKIMFASEGYYERQIPVSLLWSKNLKADIKSFIKKRKSDIKKAEAKKEAEAKAKIKEKKAAQKRWWRGIRASIRKDEAKKEKVKREFKARLKKKYG